MRSSVRRHPVAVSRGRSPRGRACTAVHTSQRASNRHQRPDRLARDPARALGVRAPARRARHHDRSRLRATDHDPSARDGV